MRLSEYFTNLKKDLQELVLNIRKDTPTGAIKVDDEADVVIPNKAIQQFFSDGVNCRVERGYSGHTISLSKDELPVETIDKLVNYMNAQKDAVKLDFGLLIIANNKITKKLPEGPLAYIQHIADLYGIKVDKSQMDALEQKFKTYTSAVEIAKGFGTVSMNSYKFAENLGIHEITFSDGNATLAATLQSWRMDLVPRYNLTLTVPYSKEALDKITDKGAQLVKHTNKYCDVEITFSSDEEHYYDALKPRTTLKFGTGNMAEKEKLLDALGFLKEDAPQKAAG